MAVPVPGIPTALCLGIGVFAILLASLFVAIRLWCTWKKERRFLIEEYLSIIALILLVIDFAIDFNFETFQAERFLGIMNRAKASAFSLRSETGDVAGKEASVLVYLTRMDLAQVVVTALLSFFAKVPILILYFRLFNVLKWVRIACYVSVAVTLVQIIAITSTMCAFCTPPEVGKYDSLLSKCVRWKYIAVVWYAIIAVIMDLVLFILPFPIIANLRLPRRKKIHLSIVFLAGVVAITSSGIALFWKTRLLISQEIPFSYVLLLTNTCECTIAIIIGCVPAIPSFWADYVSNTTAYRRMLSALSLVVPHKNAPPIGTFDALSGNPIHKMGNDHSYTESNPADASKSAESINGPAKTG